MLIIKQEIRVDEEGRSYEYIEYDKKLGDGTPYSESRYIPTEEEINAEPSDPIEQLKKQTAELQQQNFILMDALATIYEELLFKEVL